MPGADEEKRSCDSLMGNKSRSESLRVLVLTDINREK